MNVIGLTGVVASVLLVTIAIELGGPPELFVNVPSLLVTAGVAIGMQLVSFGSGALGDFGRLVRVLSTNTRTDSLRMEHSGQLHVLARHLYAASLIGGLLGLIQVLFNLDDINQLGPAIAICLLTVFYAALFAECLVRPAAHRVEFLLTQQKPREGSRVSAP